jgi:choline dehydrogenase-like flavoprotein/predicted dehydrogenase
MIFDFDAPGVHDELTCDVCVVGSGPAGLSVALEFAGTATRVIVLESGGDAYEPSAEALSLFENVGHRRAHPSAVRRRIFGGTSSIWSGRCVPISPVEFQYREWIPHSGWPVSYEDLEPYFQRAGRVLQTGPAVYDNRIWSLLGERAPNPPWDTARFETQVFQASLTKHTPTRQIPPPHDPSSENLGALQHSHAPIAQDVGESTRQDFAASESLHVLLHGHATEVITDELGEHARGVRIQSLNGRRGVVHAQHVVLACGAVDNARLLLLSRERHAQGLGNYHDQVGRYFQDHHYGVVATLERTQAPRLRRRMGFRWFDEAGTRFVYALGASFSAQCQREERLPRAMLSTFEFPSRPAALGAARRVAEKLLGRDVQLRSSDLASALLHPLELLTGAVDRYALHRPTLPPLSQLGIGCNVEQIPNPESRITLGTGRDALGQPVARIDWRLDDREFAAYRRAGELFIKECQRLGLETPKLAPWLLATDESWRSQLHDMAHPMCSTRMSADPRNGVVDANCDVHGVKGLHVAGTSVFSTGGAANPTLMAVSLAIRLADHIKSLRASRPVGGEAAPHIAPARTERIRVGIVGAGSRVRTIYHPVLAAHADRIEVVGFTSRTEDSRKALAALTGWSPYASLDELVASARPQFLIVAVSGEANVPVLNDVIARGYPVLAETPLAWNERAGRALVRAAQARGLSLGVAEQFPFLPAEQLKRKLIRLGAIGAIKAVVNDFSTYDYHGIAQLRAYVGYDREPRAATAQRFSFGLTGVLDGHQPSNAAMAWSEEWLTGNVSMSGGELLVQDFSAGYASLPTRPKGQLRVLGECGSLVDQRLIHVDRVTGRRTEAAFDVQPDCLSALHPDLGRVEWRKPAWSLTLDDEQLAVGLHVEAFREALVHGGLPLYTGAEALADVEILRGLAYSASLGGRPVSMPLNTRYQMARTAPGKLSRAIKRRIGR